MKTTELTSTEIKEYWKPEKAGDAIYGTYISNTTGGKGNPLIILDTPNGNYGVNVTATMEDAFARMEQGKDYLVKFEGYAKSKKGMEYMKISVSNFEPEDASDEKQLEQWKEYVTFNLGDELPF